MERRRTRRKERTLRIRWKKSVRKHINKPREGRGGVKSKLDISL